MESGVCVGASFFFVGFMKSSQITLYNSTSFRASKKEVGSVMFDSAMFVLIGAGSSSLFVAFVEYAYQRRKRMRTEAA